MSKATVYRKQQFPVKYHRIIKISLLVLGIGFIAIGIVRGEAAVILQKAILICLECIGIG